MAEKRACNIGHGGSNIIHPYLRHIQRIQKSGDDQRDTAVLHRLRRKGMRIEFRSANTEKQAAFSLVAAVDRQFADIGIQVPSRFQGARDIQQQFVE